MLGARSPLLRLDLSGGQGSLADHHAQRAAQQLGVGEFLARPGLAVVEQDLDARLGQLGVDALRSLECLLPGLAEADELNLPA